MSKIVCGCMGISEEDILAAINDGATTLEEIEDATGAGSCCGACTSDIQLILKK